MFFLFLINLPLSYPVSPIKIKDVLSKEDLVEIAGSKEETFKAVQFNLSFHMALISPALNSVRVKEARF